MLLRPFKSRNCGRTLMTFADSADAEIANARTITAMKFCQRTERRLVGGYAEDNSLVYLSGTLLRLGFATAALRWIHPCPSLTHQPPSTERTCPVTNFDSSL